jgi:hypothetical protein
MGIMTRRQGEGYVITSDRASHASPTKRAPRKIAEVFQVWTGTIWSADLTAAIVFPTIDEADEYVRSHFAQVTG